MAIPTVDTRAAYWQGEGQNLTLYMIAVGHPEDCIEPGGSAFLIAQWRKKGDANWIPTSPVDMTYSILYMRMWDTTNIEKDETYEVRGAVYYTFYDGSSAGWIYGDTHEITISPAIPLVGITRAWKSGDTTAKALVNGRPAKGGTADLYVQYREVGEAGWDETAKQAITFYMDKVFDITGLDPAKDYEARAALDFDDEGTPTTIYSEIVPIEEEPVGLECETKPAGAGTEANPYIVTDICELNWIGGDSPTDTLAHRRTAYYELGNSIDAAETRNWYFNDNRGIFEGWRPISYFTGSFVGHGHMITTLFSDRYAFNSVCDVGLFKKLGAKDYPTAGALYVGNVRILDVDFKGLAEAANTGYPSHNAFIGGLAGEVGLDANLVIENIETSGKCTALGYSPWWAWGRRSINAGGMIGYGGRGTIRQSFSSVEVLAAEIDEGSQKRSLPRAGGVFGWSGRIYAEDCYARGKVTAVRGTTTTANTAGGFAASAGEPGVTITAFNNCYSTGEVISLAIKGGLVGQRYGTTAVNNSFWDKQTSDCETSDGGTGKTTAQMKSIVTFIDTATEGLDVAWDFDTIWNITPSVNDGYPFLFTRVPVAPGGYLWVEGNRLAYTDQYNTKRRIWGWTTGATGDPGYLWIDGTYLYWVDAHGNVRREIGWSWWPSLVGTTGYIWVEGKSLAYLTDGEVKRTLVGSRWS